MALQDVFAVASMLGVGHGFHQWDFANGRLHGQITLEFIAVGFVLVNWYFCSLLFFLFKATWQDSKKYFYHGTFQADKKVERIV